MRLTFRPAIEEGGSVVNGKRVGPYPLIRRRAHWTAAMARMAMVAGAAAVVAASVAAVPSAAATPAYGVSVGYADAVHSGTFLPSPWQGDPGVNFVGAGPSFDAGAVQIVNATGADITVDAVTVDVGEGYHYDLWGSGLVAPAGGSLILTQTDGENFDTS